MHVARPQLRRETVALAVEQQERVIAGRLKVTFVGILLLLPVDWNLRRIHVQHRALRRIDRFRPGNQLAVDHGQDREVLFLGQKVRLERLQPGRQRRSSLPNSFRTYEPEGGILFMFFPRESAKWSLMSLLNPKRSSNSRTSSRPPSDVTRDP